MQHIVLAINGLRERPQTFEWATSHSLLLALLRHQIPFLTYCFYSHPASPAAEDYLAQVQAQLTEQLGQQADWLAQNQISWAVPGQESKQAPPLLTLSYLFQHNGRAQLLQAGQKLLRFKTAASQLTPAEVLSALENPHLPLPDLVIYTKNEKRLGHVLSWQTAYSEYLFIESSGLTFSAPQLEHCLQLYQQRQRRFGSG